MVKSKLMLALISIGLIASTSLANAAVTNGTDTHAKRVIVAPNCLLQHTNNMVNADQNLKILSTDGKYSLLMANDVGIAQLIAAKDQQRAAEQLHANSNAQQTVCGGFMDVSEDWKAQQPAAVSSQKLYQHFLSKHHSKAEPSTEPTEPKFRIQYETEVNTLLKKMNPQNMWTNLTQLSDFRDRYAMSENGVKAAQWIKSQVEHMATENGRHNVTAYFVKTGNHYKQPSLVVKFGDQSGPGIVIGAHMDTLSGSYSKKPGADDDGTGSVTVLEVARTIFNSGLNFKKPIYFIWYAAEEEGLVGSSYVVKEFKSKNIPVDAVIHFDMTGYAYKNDPTIWLISDYTNDTLTKYLETLINTYVKKPINYTKCGYACSDHATWHKNGFRATIPFEAKFGNDNPNIHTSRDTMEWLSLDHMTSYAQIGVAFAVELAEPLA